MLCALNVKDPEQDTHTQASSANFNQTETIGCCPVDQLTDWRNIYVCIMLFYKYLFKNVCSHQREKETVNLINGNIIIWIVYIFFDNFFFLRNCVRIVYSFYYLKVNYVKFY